MNMYIYIYTLLFLVIIVINHMHISSPENNIINYPPRSPIKNRSANSLWSNVALEYPTK